MDLAARLAEDPARAALFFDVDGVLAPIVPRPEDARVPAATREALHRLCERYALVACISGRAGADARRIVGVAGITYVGNHGLELDDEAAAWAGKLAQFLGTVEWPSTENKGLTAALHYRNAENEELAHAALEEVKLRAEEEGFVARFGRKVLEVLPPLDVHKGTAVRHLLEERRLRRALYAGDDTTDLDAFRALDGLELGVRVAVSSDEGPRELRAAADVVVHDPDELLALLRRL